MNILELFPVPVGQAELDRPLTENELKFIDEIRSYASSKIYFTFSGAVAGISEEQGTFIIMYAVQWLVRVYALHDQ